MNEQEQHAAELLPCPWGPQKCHGDCQVCQRRPAVAQALAEAHHCKDCCCARSWAALGIAQYTGMSIVEHIEALKAEAAALRQRVAELEAEDLTVVGDDQLKAARVEGLRKIRGILEGKGNQTGEIFRSKAFFDAVDVIDAEIAALEGVK